MFTSLLSRLIILFLLLVSYPLARVLPIQAGWENGGVENIQMTALLLGFISSIYFAFSEKNAQWRWFALMAALVWVVLIGREWSWGAALFAGPIDIHPEMGPVYSSHQLGEALRTAMHLIAASLIFFSALIFLITRQYKSIQYLYKVKAFPWIEIVLAIVAAFLCTNAEGHGFYTFDLLSKAQQQVLEELFELCSYLSIVAGQTFVWRKIRSTAA